MRVLVTVFTLAFILGLIKGSPAHSRDDSAVASAQSQVPMIDREGTVHRSAVAVPLSTYMSDEAKRRFIDQSTHAAASLTFDGMDPASIINMRNWIDNHWYRPRVERGKALYPVEIEEGKIGGVDAYVITPKEGIARSNRDRVLINLHGGGMIAGTKWGGLAESIPIASIGKLKVVTIDYRMAPEHKFPAASEDVAAVYAELLKQYAAHNIGIYGHSAGGMLAGMAIAWFQKKGLPIPGAVGVFCSGINDANFIGGDSIYTVSGLDASVPTIVIASSELGQNRPRRSEWGYYFSDVDPLDPLFAPASSRSVLSKFPPTLLLVGTRDTSLSPTVRAHAELVKAGVDASLHVWDGMGHSFIVEMDLPESKEAYEVTTRFFDSHLGRN